MARDHRWRPIPNSPDYSEGKMTPPQRPEGPNSSGQPSLFGDEAEALAESEYYEAIPEDAYTDTTYADIPAEDQAYADQFAGDDLPPPTQSSEEGSGVIEMDDSVWERIYSGLNPSQRQGVELTEGPVLIVAGAGSGKTRVLTRRIAAHIAGGARPEEILAITFTNKAAAEMRVRVAELVGSRALDRMWVSTFHAACVRMLRMKGPERWFSVLDSSDAQKVVRSVLEDLGYEKETLAGGFVRKVASAISRAKNNLTVPKATGDRGVNDAAAAVFGGYQRALRRMKAYDFDDLLVETVRMLRENPETLAYFQEKFRYVLVDEYQDTNRAQYAIVAMISARHRNICVVGDQAQSIYRFRGATVENIRRFEQDWPGAQIVVLDQNYRSTKKILEVANVIRAGMEERSRTKLWTDGEDGEDAELYVAWDDRDEASYVVDRVLARGNPGDHAVLFRTNAQSRPIEEALMSAGIPYALVGGTRFYDRAEVKDALGYLKFCVNPGDVMSFNRIANTPRRGLGDAGVAKILEVAEARGVDLLEAAKIAESKEISGRASAAIGRFVSFCQKVTEAIETEGPSAALEVVLIGVDGSRKQFRQLIAGGMAPEKAMIQSMGQTGQGAMYSKYGDEKEAARLQNLFELGRAAAEFEAGAAPATIAEGGQLSDLSPRERTEAYLEHVTLVSDLDEAMNTTEGGGSVLLMTIHAAKGLEFPHVTVVGWEDGLLPLRFGRSRQTSEDLAEERRLAYVAVTRAEETLSLTRARRRLMYGSVVEHLESEFLSEIRKSVTLNTSHSESVLGDESSGHSWEKNWNSWQNRRGGGAKYREYWERPATARGLQAPARRPTPGPKKSSTLDDWKPLGPEAPKEDPHAKPVAEGLASGARVSHAKFGIGVVLGCEGEGDDMLVKVQFEREGQKTLLAKFAGLTVL